MLIQNMQNRVEIHDFSERGDFPPFKVAFPVEMLLFSHFIEYPTMCRYGRHGHPHFFIIMWGVAVLVRAIFRIHGLFGFSGTS